MRSLDEFAGEKLACAGTGEAPPHARGHGARRNLGRARRPPAAVVLLQRLSQSQPAPESHRRRDRGDRSATASAPARRGSSPAIIRSMPSSKIGWRGSRAPKRPASSVRAISPIPASSRRLVGADDLIVVDELSHACIHAGAKLSGAEVHLYRHGDAAHAEAILAERRSGKEARADRDRRRVFHGRRSGAARRAFANREALRRLASVRRRAWPRRVRRRARLDLRQWRRANAPPRRPRSAVADGHAVEGGRRLWRLFVRLARRRSISCARARAPSSTRPACRRRSSPPPLPPSM